MPQDGHCLASFEVILAPPKVSFSAAEKMKIPHWKRDARTPTLENKSQIPFFSSSFSAVFLGNSVTPMSTLLANNKRSCSKKWKISCQNCVFPVFPAKTLAQFCHAVLDFREHPRASSRLSRLRPIDCDAGPKQTVKIFAVFGQFLFRTSSKKTSVFRRSGIYSCDLHPKRSPWPYFRDRGVIFRATNAGQKKKSVSGRPACRNLQRTTII